MNKTIGIVINSMDSGGAEKVCATLSNCFINYGFNVVLYIKKNSGKCIYKLDSRIEFAIINYKRKAERKYILCGLSTFLSGVSYVLQLYKLIRNQKPDLLISFGVGINFFAIPIAKILNLPIIASEHTNHQCNNSLYREITRHFFYRGADIVTVLTEYDLLYYNNFLSNVRVARNPIVNHSNIQNSNRKKVILCAGTISSWHRKGFDRMLDAMVIIVKEHPDWVLRIAGKGDSEYITRLITEKGLAGYVELLGEVKDMSQEYLEAGIFALSSRFEGLPMVLLEAMSYACPCVSFDIVSGPNEIIKNGFNSYLVKDNDMSDFIKKIIILIEDQNLRASMSEKAYDSSLDYTIEKIGAQWIDMIKDVSK